MKKQFIASALIFSVPVLFSLCSVSLADIDTLWAAGQTNGLRPFLNPYNGVGAPDGSYTYNVTNQDHVFNNFSGGAEKGHIDSVKMMTYIYVDAAQSNDNATLTPNITNTAKTITSAMWNNHVGSGNAGYEFFNISIDGIAIDNTPVGWSFSDFTATSDIAVANVKNQGPDGGNFYYDAFAFQIFYTPNKPILTIDTVKQSSTDGAGQVTFYWDLTDPQTDNCKLTLEYSFDDATWYQAYIQSSSPGSVNNTDVNTGTSTGQVTNIATNASNATTIWNTDNAGNENGAFTGEDMTVYIKGLPNDGTNDGESVTSLVFPLDNQAPTGYSCSTPVNGAAGVVLSPLLQANSATVQSTVAYYFELATNTDFTLNVQQSGWQNAATWPLPTQLSGNTTYYWHLKTRDLYGNEGAYTAYYSFTTTSGWIFPATGTIGPCTSPSLGDGVV